MTKEESLKRIQISKYFLYKLNEVANELNNKVNDLEKLIQSGRPAGYKKDLNINEITIQESKKNFTAEILFRDYEEKINKLKLEIESLKNKYNRNTSYFDKIENFFQKYFLKSVFLIKLQKSEIKRIFRLKTNKDFDNFLNESLINFSYILENEIKNRRIIKQNEE